MREVIRLIQDIRNFLAGMAGSPPAEALAPQYVRWREVAGRRLEACATMLEKGSEYQALQLAESDPPLMDLVAQLAFAEEPRWIDFCREHQLPVPGRLDSRSIQALNAIYSKGISPNSQLYRDYRAAITSRDDQQALRIMRSIVRLNPNDTNAQVELGRLQNKRMLARLEDLKGAVTRGERDLATTLVEEIETLGAEEQLSRSEVFAQGHDIRREVLRERGIHEAGTLLIQAEKDRSIRDWKAVSASIARIQELDRERGLNLSSEEESKVATLQNYAEKQRADALVQQDFEKALSALKAFADTVDTRMLTSATLSLDEAQKLEATFATFWKRVERFQRPVPEGELARMEGIGAAIRREASRKRGAKKTVRGVAVGIGIAVLCFCVWTGYVAWRAYDYVAQITDLKSRKQAAAAAKLIEGIPASSPWGTTSVPALHAMMEETRQWAKGEQDHLAITERQLGGLEKEAAGNFTAVSPGELHKRLQEAETNVGRLAADMVSGPKDRLSELQNKVDQHFALLKNDIADKTQQHITSLVGLVKQLDFKRPSSELAPTLENIARIGTELEKLRNAEAPDLRPPVDLDASAQKLLNEAAVFSKEITALEDAKQKMQVATTVDGYKASLKDFSDLRFAETSAASPVLAHFPTADSIGSNLFFNGDLESWEAAKNDAQKGCKFYPADVAESELKQILALRDDSEIISAPRGRELLAAMKFNSVTDSSGDHYQSPLIERIDSAVRFQEGDPIIRAYFAGSLFILMKARPQQWGIQYSSRLVQDMNDLGTVLGSRTIHSGDWQKKEIREKLVPKLKLAFEKFSKGGRYLDEANQYYRLVSRVISGGITYAGYVDDAQSLRLKPGMDPSAHLWALAKEDSSPIEVKIGAAGQSNLGKVRKWSPVFRMPVNLETVPNGHP